MAGKVYLGEEEFTRLFETVKRQFSKELLQTKNLSTSIFVTDTKKKAKILFSAVAWAKMYSLVNAYSTEVEWHGLVKRKSVNEFFVYDIIVFPHEVTNVTVTADQEEYMDWLESLSDEVREDLKFHGHSHNTMAVVPSSTDMEYRKNAVRSAGVPMEGEDIDIYNIFLIANKNGALEAQIYDVTNNTLYFKEDITIDVELGGTTYSEFMENAKKIVKEKKYKVEPYRQQHIQQPQRAQGKKERANEYDYAKYLRDYYDEI